MKPTDDLLWLAFQYAADELPADEAVHFEQRLANDQAAREALAEAVALTEAVVVAEAELSRVVPVSRASSWWLQPAGWLPLAAAAGLAIVATLWWLNQVDLADGNAPRAPVAQVEQNSSDVPAATDESSLDEQLAVAWVRTQSAPDYRRATQAWDDELIDTVDSLTAASEPRPETPKWLLVAVASSDASADAPAQGADN